MVSDDLSLYLFHVYIRNLIRAVVITGCAVAQHCYNGDVSFLLEKMETLTPCKIETLKQIDTQFVRIDFQNTEFRKFKSGR